MEEDMLHDHGYNTGKVRMGRVIVMATLILLASSCAYRPPVRVDVSDGYPDGYYDELSYGEHLGLAASYESKGRFDLALKEYKKALKLREDDARVYFGLGNIYHRTRFYDYAEENFLKAIDIDPAMGVYYNNLAWVYIETLRPVAAKHMIMMGLAVDIQRRYIYLDTLGVIEISLLNFQEAERVLKEAAVMVPLTDIAAQVNIYTHFLDLYIRWNKDKEVAKAAEKLEDLRMGIPATPDF